MARKRLEKIGSAILMLTKVEIRQTEAAMKSMTLLPKLTKVKGFLE